MILVGGRFVGAQNEAIARGLSNFPASVTAFRVGITHVPTVDASACSSTLSRANPGRTSYTDCFATGPALGLCLWGPGLRLEGFFAGPLRDGRGGV